MKQGESVNIPLIPTKLGSARQTHPSSGRGKELGVEISTNSLYVPDMEHNYTWNHLVAIHSSALEIDLIFHRVDINGYPANTSVRCSLDVSGSVDYQDIFDPRIFQRHKQSSFLSDWPVYDVRDSKLISTVSKPR